jgi:hypothetical protein
MTAAESIVTSGCSEAPAGSCGTSQDIGSPERRCWTTMAPPDLQGVCHAKRHLVCGLDWRRSDGCRHHADSGFRFAAAHPKTPAYRAGDTADDLRNPEPTVLAALTAESTRLRISSVHEAPHCLIILARPAGVAFARKHVIYKVPEPWFNQYATPLLPVGGAIRRLGINHPAESRERRSMEQSQAS